MKIAILADIHGNYHGLEAILEGQKSGRVPFRRT